MKFLLDYDFTEEEINAFSSNIPPLLFEHIVNSYQLVFKNIDFLKNLGILNYKEVFIKFYDMFLMDNSNFMTIFNNYEREDLIDKINANADIVEFL